MVRCPECHYDESRGHLASCSKVRDRLDVQAQSVADNKYSGLLWIDDSDDSTNFSFNIAGGDFSAAREVLIRFAAVIQEKLDNAVKCPYFF
jgi:hypothetical protein